MSISEDIIFKHFEGIIHNYDFPEIFQNLSRETLKFQYEEKTKELEYERREHSKRLGDLENQLKNLKSKWLSGKNLMTDDEYSEEKGVLENDIQNILEQQSAVREGEKNIIEDIEEFLELAKNLSGSYKNGNKAKRAKIINTICLELILDNKKELTIRENKLFEIMKSHSVSKWYSHGELNSDLSLEKAAS